MMTITPATPTTWPRVAEIYDADGYDRAANAMRERAPIELAEHANGDRLMWFALDENDSVVATVGLAFRGKDQGLADGITSANITRLHVVQAHRRRGIATTLMSAAEQEARARNFAALTIEVEDDNTPAIRLYEKLGFTQTGRGADPQNRAMQKPLHPNPRTNPA